MLSRRGYATKKQALGACADQIRMDIMTNRTEHAARATAPLRRTRQVTLAASMAVVAVTGTATIAWSALSLALGPGSPPRKRPRRSRRSRAHKADDRRFCRRDARSGRAGRRPGAARGGPEHAEQRGAAPRQCRAAQALRRRHRPGRDLSRRRPRPRPARTGSPGCFARLRARTSRHRSRSWWPGRPRRRAPPPCHAPASAAAEDAGRLRGMWSTGLFR